MFQPSLSTTTRGHNLKLQIYHQFGPRKHFLSARATVEWNKLYPLRQDTVDAVNVDSFKRKLGKEWEYRKDLYNYSFSY